MPEIAPPPTVIEADKSYTATVDTSIGGLVFSLLPDYSPVAVNTFVYQARSGGYDDTIIHRLVHDFVLQGGSKAGREYAEPDYLIEGELPSFGRPPQSAGIYPRGTLAMAEFITGDGVQDRKLHGPQFFVTLADLDQILHPYSPVLGVLVAGDDVLTKFNGWPTTSDERPERPLSIKSVSVTEA